MGKVSIVGAGMRSHPGVAAKVFRVLNDEGINIEMISTSPIKISCVIARDRVERAVQSPAHRLRALRTRHGRGRGAFQGPSDRLSATLTEKPFEVRCDQLSIGRLDKWRSALKWAPNPLIRIVSGSLDIRNAHGYRAPHQR